ncbi:MAG: CBS domain-containing protein [Candidatus Pacearchaeota archaeon]
MTRNFISAKPDIFLSDAIKLMAKNRVGSLILTEKDILKGILTERDIIWALSKKSIKELKDIQAIDICTRKITTIRPSADIYHAMVLMRKFKVRRLPVVLNKRIIGYLTEKDVLRIQPELFEIARQGYNILEQEEKFKRKKQRKQFSEGICEECGNYNLLYAQDGKLMCEDCIEEM